MVRHRASPHLSLRLNRNYPPFYLAPNCGSQKHSASVATQTDAAERMRSKLTQTLREVQSRVSPAKSGNASTALGIISSQVVAADTSTNPAAAVQFFSLAADAAAHVLRKEQLDTDANTVAAAIDLGEEKESPLTLHSLATQVKSTSDAAAMTEQILLSTGDPANIHMEPVRNAYATSFRMATALSPSHADDVRRITSPLIEQRRSLLRARRSVAADHAIDTLQRVATHISAINAESPVVSAVNEVVADTRAKVHSRSPLTALQILSSSANQFKTTLQKESSKLPDAESRVFDVAVNALSGTQDELKTELLYADGAEFVKLAEKQIKSALDLIEKTTEDLQRTKDFKFFDLLEGTVNRVVVDAVNFAVNIGTWFPEYKEKLGAAVQHLKSRHTETINSLDPLLADYKKLSPNMPEFKLDPSEPDAPLKSGLPPQPEVVPDAPDAPELSPELPVPPPAPELSPVMDPQLTEPEFKRREVKGDESPPLSFVDIIKQRGDVIKNPTQMDDRSTKKFAAMSIPDQVKEMQKRVNAMVAAKAAVSPVLNKNIQQKRQQELDDLKELAISAFQQPKKVIEAINNIPVENRTENNKLLLLAAQTQERMNNMTEEEKQQLVPKVKHLTGEERKKIEEEKNAASLSKAKKRLIGKDLFLPVQDEDEERQGGVLLDEDNRLAKEKVKVEVANIQRLREKLQLVTNSYFDHMDGVAYMSKKPGAASREMIKNELKGFIHTITEALNLLENKGLATSSEIDEQLRRDKVKHNEKKKWIEQFLKLKTTIDKHGITVELQGQNAPLEYVVEQRHKQDAVQRDKLLAAIGYSFHFLKMKYIDSVTGFDALDAKKKSENLDLRKQLVEKLKLLYIAQGYLNDKVPEKSDTDYVQGVVNEISETFMNIEVKNVSAKTGEKEARKEKARRLYEEEKLQLQSKAEKAAGWGARARFRFRRHGAGYMVYGV